MTVYYFDHEIEALRERFNAEHSLEYRYIQPNHATLLPVIIMLDNWLGPRYPDRHERRNMRLAILSLWLDKKVESTYDLTVYQVSCILDFLEYDEGEVLNKRAQHFLEDTEARAKSENIDRESISRQAPSSGRTPNKVPDMSEFGF